MPRQFHPFRERDLRSLRSIDDIRALHALRFEWLCKFLLPYLGYRSLFVTRKHGTFQSDGGIDIKGKFAGEDVLIQCKRWNKGRNGFLPASVIRELGGCMARDKIRRGAVVATLRFSRRDRQEAERLRIELIGTEEIVATMKRIRPGFRDSPDRRGPHSRPGRRLASSRGFHTAARPPR
ncbi:MAG: restriction endonuclease [candidate division Zixibacteria bacterium]|nr:restriction endonuclease [candidate division Zixibacteria bacterium]